jgi:hypothetical protein
VVFRDGLGVAGLDHGSLVGEKAPVTPPSSSPSPSGEELSRSFRRRRPTRARFARHHRIDQVDAVARLEGNSLDIFYCRRLILPQYLNW